MRLLWQSQCRPGPFHFPFGRLNPFVVSLSNHERGFLKFPRMKRPWPEGRQAFSTTQSVQITEGRVHVISGYIRTQEGSESDRTDIKPETPRRALIEADVPGSNIQAGIDVYGAAGGATRYGLRSVGSKSNYVGVRVVVALDGGPPTSWPICTT